MARPDRSSMADLSAPRWQCAGRGARVWPGPLPVSFAPIIRMPTGPGSGRPLFTRGSLRVAPHPPRQPAARHLHVEKRLPSAVLDTPPRERLAARGTLRPLVRAPMTHMCVDSATRDTVSPDPPSVVAADACATRDRPAGAGSVVGHAPAQRATPAARGARFADVLAAAAVLALPGAE